MERQIISEGTHFLSGIERVFIKTFYNEVANGIRFVLDGKSYECYEDPEDGYRSTGVLKESDKKCKYTFPEQPVRVEWYNGDHDSCYVKMWKLTMRDPYTNNKILVIGTDNYDDYYPMAIFNYYPENMKVNQDR